MSGWAQHEAEKREDEYYQSLGYEDAADASRQHIAQQKKEKEQNMDIQMNPHAPIGSFETLKGSSYDNLDPNQPAVPLVMTAQELVRAMAQDEPAKDGFLATFAQQNIDRQKVWHGDGEPWTLADWSNAAAGEMGELCNVIKKIRRMETGVASQNNIASREDATDKAANEIGDVVIYLDILAQKMGLTLEDCIRNTFNRVSVREGLPHRI